MKNRIGAAALGVCILTVSMMGVTASAGAAAKVEATLRVVGANNKVLVDRRFNTTTTAVKTTSKATCLQEGSKNGTASIEGPTAMGILWQASETVPALRPIGISSDLGYGLGLCTIAGVTPPSLGFWALKIDHKASAVGGADAKLVNGTNVLWYLDEDYTKPDRELVLKLHSKVKNSSKVKVIVYSYDDMGKRTVVKGAKLNGVKAQPTNRKGLTVVKLGRKTSITARKHGSLPSNRLSVESGN